MLKIILHIFNIMCENQWRNRLSMLSLRGGTTRSCQPQALYRTLIFKGCNTYVLVHKLKLYFMLNTMGAPTPSNPSQTLENFLGHVNLVTTSMDRKNNHEEDGNDHEEREIPVASPSIGLQKRPPTYLTLCQCQKRVPLREVQLTST